MIQKVVRMIKVEAVDLSECYFSSKWNEHKQNVL